MSVNGICLNNRLKLGLPTAFLFRKRQAIALKKVRTIMLSWGITFLLIALVAAVLGFGGLAGTAAFAAKLCFVVFLILFIIAAISGRHVPSA